MILYWRKTFEFKIVLIQVCVLCPARAAVGYAFSHVQCRICTNFPLVWYWNIEEKAKKGAHTTTKKICSGRRFAKGKTTFGRNYDKILCTYFLSMFD